MRVTENTNFDTVRDTIRRSKERMEGLQLQSATLKKLNTPSDDPVGAAKIMEIRTDKVNNDQFTTNAKMAEAYLNNSDHALAELADIVVRAKEIAIGQASGASSNADSRLGVSEEVKQLFDQAVAGANTRIGDRYIFGGYKTQRPPVDAQGRYQGDDGQMMVEIGKDVFLSMNVPGGEAFNTNLKNSSDQRIQNYANRQPAAYRPGGSPGNPEDAEDASHSDNVNVFDELQNLRIGLLTGNQDGIRQTLERFDQIHAKLIATRAKVGSRVQGLQNSVNALERHNITNAELGSNIEDADMAQVMTDLSKEETVLRNTLQSSHKLMQPTLMDFLK